MKSFCLAFLFLIGVLIPSLYGQEKNPIQKTFQVEVQKKRRSVYFKAKGSFGYPDQTVLLLGLKYEGEANYMSWHRAVIQKGSFSSNLGPFRKTIVPGKYILEVWFKVSEQPKHLAKFLREKMHYSAFMRKKIKEKEVFFGSKKEIEEGRKSLGKEYLKQLKSIRALYLKGNKEFKWSSGSKKREAPPSKESWMKFKKEHISTLRSEVKGFYKWEKTFQFLPKSYWLRKTIKIANLVYKLTRSYEYFYLADQIKDKKHQLKLLENYEKSFQKKRDLIEFKMNQLAREIKRFIDPNWKEPGEEGVE